MKPGIIYRGTIKDTQFTTNNTLDSKTWLVHILDHGNLIADASSEQFIDMVMAGEPITGITKNNDEDKFSPILSTSVEMLVHTDTNISINTFAGGDDNRWEVKIWLINQLWFRGFLKLDDIQQDFMPDPNELLLVATDNLDILKDIALTDDNGETMQGYHKIISYIANSLKKTGLELDIKVINNIREQDAASFEASDATFVTSPNQIGTIAGPTYFVAGKKIKVTGTTSNNRIFTISSIVSSPPNITLNVVETPVTEIATGVTFNDAEGHFYEHERLEARTFEGDEVGVAHDCFTVLEKILGEHCRLFQHWGYWWIVSIDELDDNNLRLFTFDADGVFDVNSETTPTYGKDIGIDNDESIFFINEDAIVKATRPHKYIKETFNLQTPIEIVCNIDFSRGDLIDEDVGFSTYVLDDWTRDYNFPTGGTNTGDAYIRRNFNDLDLEESRYAVIEPETSTNEGFIKSCAIPVGARDKFTLSFDWAFSADAAGSGGYTRELGYCLLFGNDSTYWSMDELGVWRQSNVTWSVNLRTLEQTIELSDDQTEFTNFSVDSKEIPVSGDLYIWLQSESISRYNVDVYYNNLNFDYRAFVNDGYKPVEAQYHKITSLTTNNKVKREEEVFISDSPRRIFKGALHKFDGNDYVLTEKFFKYNIFFDTQPSATDYKTFGEWQAWWVWNQFRLANREFDFTAQGIDSNTLLSSIPDPISPLHRYYLTDVNESTTDRHFMLLHHEANVHLGEWSGFISEVFNAAEGKDYGSVTADSTTETGRWFILVYNIGAGNVTRYFMDVTSVSPSGYYRQNTPSVPPYPATANLTDFTYVGAGISDLLTYLGITYLNLVSFTYSGSDTSLTVAGATIITAEHEFKYILE